MPKLSARKIKTADPGKYGDGEDCNSSSQRPVPNGFCASNGTARRENGLGPTRRLNWLKTREKAREARSC